MGMYCHTLHLLFDARQSDGVLRNISRVKQLYQGQIFRWPQTDSRSNALSIVLGCSFGFFLRLVPDLKEHANLIWLWGTWCKTCHPLTWWRTPWRCHHLGGRMGRSCHACPILASIFSPKYLDDLQLAEAVFDNIKLVRVSTQFQLCLRYILYCVRSYALDYGACCASAFLDSWADMS